MPISALLSRRSAVTIAEVFRLLLTEKYSGSVTFHLSNGQPRKVEYGPMYQIPIYSTSSSAESLDKAV